ncbi:hypothetical protein [Arcanobacterium phocae]|uniref:hypothetical protein n=1 Tax=Arcanobacterium phocae TaxID=131112 RepID=UPI001C0F29F2|nr:hypothetical protein [Arcanobacterium phocae]
MGLEEALKQIRAFREAIDVEPLSTEFKRALAGYGQIEATFSDAVRHFSYAVEEAWETEQLLKELIKQQKDTQNEHSKNTRHLVKYAEAVAS